MPLLTIEEPKSRRAEITRGPKTPTYLPHPLQGNKEVALSDAVTNTAP